MHLHRVAAHLVVPVVQLLLDQRPRQHAPFVVQKQLQHRQFARRQRHLLTVAAHAAGGAVEHHVAVRQLWHQLAVTTADQRLQARRHFGQRERFAQIVVGAALQPADPLLQRIAGGKDQHRHILPGLAPLAQEIQSIEARQAEIEDHRVIRRAAQGVFTNRAVGEPVQIEAEFGQPGLDAVPDQFVIFDQQNSHEYPF